MDTTTTNGRSIRANCIADWLESHKVDLGRHQSRYPYGREYPITSDWSEWKTPLTRLTLANFSLLQPLGPWTTPSPWIWQYYLKSEDKKLEVVQDNKIDMYAQGDNKG